MRIETQSLTQGGYNYDYNNVYNNAANIKSPAFKSLLYNPKSFIHKTNPVLRFLDNYFNRSLAASRRTWHVPDKELKPYIKVVDIENKKQPHVRMWDINNGEKTKYVIILHGLSHNITSLQEMYKKIFFKTDYAVLAPEYHGFTPENNENIYLDPKKLSRDTETFVGYLNSKGIENKNISIIGHSFGGYTAAKLAKKHDNIESVILVSSINTNEHQARKLKEKRFRHVPKGVKNIINKYKFATLPLKLIFNTGKILKNVKSPVDIIHAKSDKYINIKTCVDLAHNCKNLRSLNLVEGYHRMDDNKIDTIVSILNSNTRKVK